MLIEAVADLRIVTRANRIRASLAAVWTVLETRASLEAVLEVVYFFLFENKLPE